VGTNIPGKESKKGNKLKLLSWFSVVRYRGPAADEFIAAGPVEKE
jgi:hypothetical protein